jgi:hypothetical protein
VYAEDEEMRRMREIVLLSSSSSVWLVCGVGTLRD